MRRLLKKRPSLQDTSPPIPHGVSAASPPLPSPIKDKVRASLDLDLAPPDFAALEREEGRMKNVPPSAYTMGAGARPWGLTRLRSWKGKKRDPSPGPTAQSPTGYNSAEVSDPPPIPSSPTKAAAVSVPQHAVGPGPASPANPVEGPLTPLSPSLSRYSSAPPGPSTDLHQSRQVTLPQPSCSPSLLSSVSSPSASSQPTTDSTTRLIPTSPTRPSLHRKLTKRRPKSSSEAFELIPRPNLSALPPFDLVTLPSSTSISLDASANGANVSGAFPVPVSSPAAVPDGTEPAFHSTASSSSLNRNNTSSTASSNVGPATEESMLLESPAVSVVGNNRGTFGHVWDQSTPLSRSSTLSFREGDDELLHPKIPPAQGPEGFQTPNRPVPPDLPESPNGSLVASSQVTIDSTSTTTPASRLNISHPRLRAGTSHLDAHRPNAEEPAKRSVDFDIVDVVDVTPEQSIPRTRNDSRAQSLSRRRSSSLGAMSNTTSMYSVGEIEIATRTVFASPTTLRMEEILLTPVALTPAAATTLNHTASSPPPHGVGLASENVARSTSYSARPPPLPPHLSALPQMPDPLTSDAERSRSAQKSRPTVQRNGSLSRLWRKLSSTGSGDRRSPALIISPENVPPVPDPPKSRGSISHSPTDQVRLRKISRETRETPRMKAGMTAAPRPRPRTTSLSASKQSTPAVRRTSSARTPSALPPARSDDIPALPSLHKGKTKSSVPPRSTSLESPISNGTGPAFRPAAPTRMSSRWLPPPHTSEERIRYRQSLVEIQDDLVFQRVLEDLADADGSDGGVMLMRSTSRQALEMRSRKEGMQAWFVAREIIQGERRYGRLLAKGVALVRSHLESQLSIPPASTPPRPSASPPRKHPPKSPSDRLVRLSAPPSIPDGNIPAIAFARTPDIVHLRTIEAHLSRLLSLSSSLCTAFEDDPSPSCIATAFLNAQEDLSTEIGGWAGEVGNLIAIGLGDLMDQQIAVSRHASSIDLAAMGEEEVRLGFGDIIILPIQRAARYQLLFRELVNKVPPADDVATKVSEALKAAERLGEECDRKQTFDLNSLRRGSQISSSSSEPQFEGEARSRKDTKAKAKVSVETEEYGASAPED